MNLLNSKHLLLVASVVPGQLTVLNLLVQLPVILPPLPGSDQITRQPLVRGYINERCQTMTDQTARQGRVDGQPPVGGVSRRSLFRAAGVGAAVVWQVRAGIRVGAVCVTAPTGPVRRLFRARPWAGPCSSVGRTDPETQHPRTHSGRRWPANAPRTAYALVSGG